VRMAVATAAPLRPPSMLCRKALLSVKTEEMRRKMRDTSASDFFRRRW
jgi:hypothetical protein